MTLDQCISRAKEHYAKTGNKDSLKISEWLTELKRYKRLIKNGGSFTDDRGLFVNIEVYNSVYDYEFEHQ